MLLGWCRARYELNSLPFAVVLWQVDHQLLYFSHLCSECILLQFPLCFRIAVDNALDSVELLRICLEVAEYLRELEAFGWIERCLFHHFDTFSWQEIVKHQLLKESTVDAVSLLIHGQAVQDGNGNFRCLEVAFEHNINVFEKLTLEQFDWRSLELAKLRSGLPSPCLVAIVIMLLLLLPIICEEANAIRTQVAHITTVPAMQECSSWIVLRLNWLDDFLNNYLLYELCVLIELG